MCLGAEVAASTELRDPSEDCAGGPGVEGVAASLGRGQCALVGLMHVLLQHIALELVEVVQSPRYQRVSRAEDGQDRAAMEELCAQLGEVGPQQGDAALHQHGRVRLAREVELAGFHREEPRLGQ